MAPFLDGGTGSRSKDLEQPVDCLLYTSKLEKFEYIQTQPLALTERTEEAVRKKQNDFEPDYKRFITCLLYTSRDVRQQSDYKFKTTGEIIYGNFTDWRSRLPKSCR